MKTFIPNPKSLIKKWYVIDAGGRVLGKVASEAAKLLRGKHKTEFTPNFDCGDCVVILNASSVVLTGKKLDQKFWHTHTGYVGNLKSVSYATLMKSKPGAVVLKSVKGMLPKNSLGRKLLTNLRVYADDKHNHDAQSPQVWNF